MKTKPQRWARAMKERISIGIVMLILMIGIVPPVFASLTDGLAAYWKFDDNYADSTANGNYGTPSGTVGFDADTGKFNSALSLVNYSGYVGITENAGFNFGGNFTIGGWIYLSNGYYGAYEEMILSRYGSSGQGGFRLDVAGYGQGANVGKLLFLGGVGYQNLVSDNQVPLNQWTYVAVVMDNTNDKIQLYINGLADGALQSVDSVPSYSENPLAFGTSDWWPYQYIFDGKIDDFAIWSRGLSSTEISDIYNAPGSLGTLLGGGAPLGDGGVPEPATVVGLLSALFMLTSRRVIKRMRS